MQNVGTQHRMDEVAGPRLGTYVALDVGGRWDATCRKMHGFGVPAWVAGKGTNGYGYG